MKRFILILLLLFIRQLSVAADKETLKLINELQSAEGAQKIDMLNQISKIYREENPNKARYFINEALKLSEINKYYQGRVVALLNLGIIEEISGNFKIAEESYSSALKISSENNYIIGIIKSKINLGNLYESKGHFKESLIYLTQAYEMSRKYNLKKLISTASQNLSYVYDDLYDHNKALELIDVSIMICKEFKDRNGLAASLIAKALIYLNLKNFEKSLFYNKEALKYIDTSKNLSHTETIYNNLAISYSKLGYNNKALEYYFKSLNKCSQIPDSISIACSYLNIGEEYNKIGEDYKAKLYIDKSIDIYQRMDNPSDLGNAYLARGSYFMREKQFTNSEEDFIKALRLFKGHEIVKGIRDALALLTESYMLSENEEAALQNFREYRNINDTLLYNEKAKSLEMTNSKISALSEISRLNNKLTIEREKYIQLVLILLSVVVIISLGVIFYFVSKRLSRKLNVSKAELNKMKENSKSINQRFAKEVKEQMFALGCYIIDSESSHHYKELRTVYDKIAFTINETLSRYNSYDF